MDTPIPCTTGSYAEMGQIVSRSMCTHSIAVRDKTPFKHYSTINFFMPVKVNHANLLL